MTLAKAKASFKIEIADNPPTQDPNNDLVIQIVFKKDENLESDASLENGAASTE